MQLGAEVERAIVDKTVVESVAVDNIGAVRALA
jgi:hypothetical protein